jgi:hypothetical protein
MGLIRAVGAARKLTTRKLERNTGPTKKENPKGLGDL